MSGMLQDPQPSDEMDTAQETQNSNDNLRNHGRNNQSVHKSTNTITLKMRVIRFVKKYFLEGQKLQEDAHQRANLSMPLWKQVVTSRRFWGIAIPLIFFEVCWWSLATKHNLFRYFPEKYPMSITMIFGALVAGMTSEGGGAVAFPVMTLALHISPTVARDFSLMIQTCGMSAAAFTIYYMEVKVEKHSLLYCSLGKNLTKFSFNGKLKAYINLNWSYHHWEKCAFKK